MPEAFWGATFYEVSCAYVGHCRRHGIGRWSVDSNGLSGADIDALKVEEALMRERFPDARLDKAAKRLRRQGAHAAPVIIPRDSPFSRVVVGS